MSRGYDRYERTTRRAPRAPQRSTLGHWGPLILTVAVATIGIAAWVWSERRDDDDGEDEDGNRRWPRPGESGQPGPPPGYGGLREGESSYGTTYRQPEESSTYMARMSGALKRAPSPQQIFDGASKTVAAGVAAAGAVVGSALSSIREEDKNAFKDHKTWSEEAEARKSGRGSDIPGLQGPTKSSSQSQRVTPGQSTIRRKTVAIVVSADADNDGVDDGEEYHHEHASILTHLPKHIDFSRVRLFVLIYSPDLKEHPLDATSSKPPGSLSSSFSNIGHEQAHTPSEEVDRPLVPLSPATPAFNALWSEAQAIVEKDTMVLPFTTRTGHVHILRHLSPDYVFLEESLAGNNGEVVNHLQTWLRQDVVLVVGAGGHGGLADSESEAEQTGKTEHWWEREDRVGRGRGVVVVESLRVGDDWARRIEGRE